MSRRASFHWIRSKVILEMLFQHTRIEAVIREEVKMVRFYRKQQNCLLVVGAAVMPYPVIPVASSDLSSPFIM